MSERYDLGSGFSFSFFTEQGMEVSTGLIIVGPVALECKYKDIGAFVPSGLCGGGVHFDNSPIGLKEGRPRWHVVSWEPLTLTPSIACKCGGQHGYITDGIYIPC